ncbi:methyltransferase domain-containing protein [Nocardia jinanensis]|nr:methyltransferase domain-containing protein [Nocardia jinanensis]
MIVRPAPGLGELLRYVGELVDHGAGEMYESLGMSYRPRYTPVLRAMSLGAATVTDITALTHVTQGAVSQAVGLMVTDGLVVREQLPDGRKSGLRLTPEGRKLVGLLEPHWEATFAAVVGLEREIGFPIRRALADAATALESRGFAPRIREARVRTAEPDISPGRGIATATNWFDRGGQAYAQFRPEYPGRLSMFLAALAPSTDLAVDVGCGSGQLTTRLASHFDTTIGIDPSDDQLANARPRDRVRYLRAPAEELPVPDRSATLITAAQAAHWFDRPAFYSEVRRIAADDAVIALISYGVLRPEPAIAPRFDHFYGNEIGSYWPPERKLVDTGYSEIDFPFEEYPVPPMQIRKNWNLAELLGYVSTWSAVRRAEADGATAVLHSFAADLTELWGDPTAKRTVSWPLVMRLGIL